MRYVTESVLNLTAWNRTEFDGVAMGSPLGPALANIFVGYYEKKIPQNEWPEMYYRYVDDVFSHFQNKHSSVIFFKRLNSLHPALQFTMEGEVDGSLPFLEERVTRVASGMVTSLHRKPTFTGLYTPWDSFSPTVYKINLVRALTFRINRVSSPAVVQEELDILRTILMRNGYPGQILDRWVTPSSAQPERLDWSTTLPTDSSDTMAWPRDREVSRTRKRRGTPGVLRGQSTCRLQDKASV